MLSQRSDLREADFTDAFVALSDGILLTDAGGHILSANPAAGRILAVDRLIGTLFEEQPAIHRARAIDDVDGHLVRRAEYARDDRSVTVEIVTTAMPGKDGLHIHTLRDITAQVELMRLKEDFLLQVAHELRTPIATLSASLDLVLQDALTMPRDQLAMLVRTLGRSALRLENLVENLLDAGSIEAGTSRSGRCPRSSPGRSRARSRSSSRSSTARGSTSRSTSTGPPRRWSPTPAAPRRC